MRQYFLLGLVSVAAWAALTGIVASGCGSTVVEGPVSFDVGGGGSSSGVGFPSTTSAGAAQSDGGHDALPDYTDPGCPDAPPPIYDYQCDPYNQFNGDCASGEACYIYVDYPSDPCGQETYGSICSAAGFGQQGDPCGSPLDCAAGLVCVVTGSGTQCVHLCPLTGQDGCPEGLVCEPIDVEGFGGCL